MKLEHIGMWTKDIEKLKTFYETFFDAKGGTKYINSRKRYQSYFLVFTSGARLELMQRDDIGGMEKESVRQEFLGYAHLAFSVGSETAVDVLTSQLTAAGCEHVDGPRRTGDGYYESVVLDPEGNRIEVTV